MAPAGLAGLPSPCSEHAPHFTDAPNENIDTFLRRFDTLADDLSLSNDHRVLGIIRFTSDDLQSFWTPSKNYISRDWPAFRKELHNLHQNVKTENLYTRAGLQAFITCCTQNRLTDEDDLIVYRRRFLRFSRPLHTANKLTKEEEDSNFFNGFHPHNRDILKNRLFTMNPTRPQTEALDFDNTLEAAQSYIANDHFHRPSTHATLDDIDAQFGMDAQQPRPRQKRDPSPHQEYTTKQVRFEASKNPPEEDSLHDLIHKMHKLTTRDKEYTVLYAQCKQCYLNIVQELRKPEMFQTSSTFNLQSANAPWSQPQPPASAPVTTPTPPTQHPWQQPQYPMPSPDTTTFFRRPARPPGCAFCTKMGHILCTCSEAELYVSTGCVTIQEGRLYLPNGQFIPNDRSNRGLKHGIDTWYMANTTPTPDAFPPPSKPPMPTTFQREAPPHVSLSFEAIHSEVHMAQITDTAETEMPEDLIDDNNIGSEIFDLFEVLATEQQKNGSKPQDAPPPTAPPPTAPTYAAPPRPAVNATPP
jgi:hypothetical protein